MPLLEMISELQNQGVSEQDIIQNLKEQGYSPTDINDAMNQIRIKSAVTGDYEQSQNMQQGILQQEYQQPIPAPAPGMPQEYAYQQQYSPEYYPPQPAVSNETITEIAEQIVYEKLAELKKLIGNIAEFKIMSDAKISSIDERLRRIESIIIQLNSAILKKVGDYGQAIEDLRDDVSSTQESFSKLINPIVQSRKGKSSEEKQEEEKSKKKGKSKAGVESYLMR